MDLLFKMMNYYPAKIKFRKEKKINSLKSTSVDAGAQKRQVTYIAPLNHLPLLPSGPGGVQQELAV